MRSPDATACIRNRPSRERGGMKAHATTADLQIAQATNRARALVVVGAFLSFLFSVTLWFSGMREEGLFVGLWVPSILGLGTLLMPGKR